MKKLKRRIYLWFYEKISGSGERFSPHGIEIYIPSNADVDIRYLLSRGRPYEEEEAKLIRRYIEPKSNVIEFGGCFGIVSAIVRNQIGRDATHIIVEAIPKLAEICSINASVNAGPNTTKVIQAAVDYSGMNKVEFSTGHNAHVGHVARPGETGLKIPTTTLSKIAKDEGLDSFDFVCDIEGAEIALFENEVRIFDKVSTIVLETHPAIYPNKNADLKNLLGRIENMGFEKKAELNNVFCFQKLKK